LFSVGRHPVAGLEGHVLSALRISNFAVIDAAEVEFGAGLTVMTGETGAGKSILVDALGLLLGGRAEVEVIRAGADEASVEALFERTPLLAARLEELGLPDLGEQVSVRRIVGRNGRGRAWVNGSLVNIGLLGRLMRGLVDISGQHEHVSLFDGSLHRELLDRYAGLESDVAGYRAAHARMREVDGRIEALGGDEKTARARSEFLRFQLDELERLSPVAGEDVLLEEERRRLMGAEKLRKSSAEAENLLTTQDDAALELTGRASGLLEDAARIDARLKPVCDRVAAAMAELEEAGRALGRYLGQIDGDPARLAEVDERLDLIRRTCRKHGTNLEGLVARRDELAKELSLLENRQESLDLLLAERSEAEKCARALAAGLTQKRAKNAKSFAAGVSESLAHLALGKSRFEVHLEPTEALGHDGADRIEFLFSANPGEPPRPLEKVASGGEASRLLLAMKRVLAGSDGCGCYVLDEADSGVSGGVAEVVGRMIKDVSAHRQVLCITHLPQVAAYADAHLSIRKHQGKDRTVSRVVPLHPGEERTRELARMLSGVEITREAMGAAEALVRSANRSQPGFRRAERGGGGGKGRLRRSA
jgi:DNA repair protein RecN (Recombination protein N)